MTLSEWQAKIGQWSLETFGPGVRFAPHIEHIRRELIEMERAADSGEGIWDEELTDVLILVLGLAHRAGIDLETELALKHMVNLGRQWGLPDASGVTEHIRSESEVP